MLFTLASYAQKFKPDFIEINQWAEGFEFSTLTVDKVLEITGFPELEKMSLDKGDFELDLVFVSQSFHGLSLGYELLKSRDRKNKAYASFGLGYGRIREITNSYDYEVITTFSKVYNGDTVTVDSTYKYYAYSGFRYRHNLYLSLSIQQELLSYKVWSLHAGLTFLSGIFNGGEKLQGEVETIRYSNYFEGGFQRPFAQRIIPDLNKNMYFTGMAMPISIHFDLRSEYNFFDRLSFIYNNIHGLGWFFGSEIPNFTTRSKSANLCIRYSF